MQGLIYHYLREFVESDLGSPLWERACARAGVAERSFLLTRQYPDQYVYALVSAIQEELGPGAPASSDILFGFGRFVGRRFQREFGFYFRRFATAREMIAGIEPIIHTELRRHDPRSQPPALRTSPVPGGGLRVLYRSPRRLCDVLRGLATEVGAAFGEEIAIDEPTCMNRGGPVCEVLLSFSGSGSAQSGASPP